MDYKKIKPENAEKVVTLGIFENHDDASALECIAQSFYGQSLIREGQVDKGQKLLNLYQNKVDVLSSLLLSDEVEKLFSGDEMSDLNRAISCRKIIIKYYNLSSNLIDKLMYRNAFEAIEHFFKYAWNLKETSSLDDFAQTFKFTNLDYRNRRLVACVKNIEDCGGCLDNMWLFEMNNYPPDILFPVGHPRVNEIYIGHPFKNDVYVPFLDSEYLFFLDKMDELSVLLQCLGAKEISLTSIKGRSVNECSNEVIKVEAGLDYKLSSGQANYSGKSSANKVGGTKQYIMKTLKFAPVKKPYVPEGLVWYPHIANWQRLVQQRIEGNLLEYHQIETSSETEFMSASEIEEVKASAKILLTAAKVSYDNNVESKFQRDQSTEWRVDVVFK